jgi:tetratricopeptide (TPR) repeat protein
LAALVARLERARRAEEAARRARAQQAAVESTPPAAAALTPERRREVEELYRRGVAAMQEGRAADAMRYWELVWSFAPDHERVREHLKREYLTRGLELFAQGSLDASIQQLQKALQMDPADPRALAYLQRAQEQRSRTRAILGQGE